jgi:hypothetical protein
MREDDSLQKVIYVGDVQGSEKVNVTSLKTTHVGTIAIGFTVLVSAV